MSARQSFHLHFEEEIILRNIHRRKVEFSRSCRSPGTTYEQLPFVFRVQVQQNITGHETGLHPESTAQTCFFVTGKHTFYRAVGNIRSVQQGQLHRHAYPVVGTQRRPVRTQPISINQRTNRVFFKIELHLTVLLANHIHVAL